jgi:hypothetical protein
VPNHVAFSGPQASRREAGGAGAGKTYTPLKAAQSARAANPSAHAGCFNFCAMGWAHSPRAAHPFAHAVALIFGL